MIAIGPASPDVVVVNEAFAEEVLQRRQSGRQDVHHRRFRRGKQQPQ